MAVKLEVNQKILLTIKRLGINGEGIGYYKRKAVFVTGVLPPEEAIVKITEDTERYAKGELVNLRIKAAKRAKPFCKHYGVCGGCQTQHIMYEEQLALKEEMLMQTIERYSGLNPENVKFNNMIGMANPRAYRHKAQIPVKQTKNGLTMGLFKLNSNELVEINDCPIHAKRINSVLQQVIEICDRHEIYAFDPKSMRGMLRHIVVRTSHKTDEIQVTLVITIFNKVLLDAAKDIINILDVVSVGISKNRDSKNVEIFGEDVEILAGKNYISEGIDEIKYDLNPKAFFQLNPEQAIKLYGEVKNNINFETDKVIIDAYSGAGAISLFLAPYAKKIIGIDVSKESVYSALHNKKLNKFSNVSYELGEVNSVLPKLYDKGIEPDVLIIDPPRSGIDYQTLDILTRKVLKKIIYISCNPSTLAKNLKVLTKKYNVKSITPYDMFPQTSHIESITILEKK